MTRTFERFLVTLGLMLLVGCNETPPAPTASTTLTSQPPVKIETPPVTTPAEEPVKPAVVELANPPVTEPAKEPITTPMKEPTEGPSLELAQGTAAPETPAKETPAKEAPAKQPLFVDWPKPQVLLVFSGQQQGFIEPCGCTGLANQKGGIARRSTFLTELKEKGWPVVPLDVGNHIRRAGTQQEIKFQRSADALRIMEYSAATLGVDDYRLDSGVLINGMSSADDKPNPFISANVAIVDRSLTATHRIIEAGGKKIGITAVLGDTYIAKLPAGAKEDGSLIVVSAEEGLKGVVETLTAAKCDVYVLLAHATEEETAALAKKFPLFQLVATSSGVGEPPIDLEVIPDAKPKQVQVGTKGMFLMAVGVFDDAQQPFRAQRVPLDERFADAPKMRELMASYQAELRSLVLTGWEGLGLRPQPTPNGVSFVGAEKCGQCHTKAYAIWEKTPHAHATDTLVKPKERGDISRHFDPECLSCHVTGWEPQGMYPFATGYLSLEKTPHMKQNGCENCHGPGAKHTQVELGELSATEKERDELRKGMRLELAGDKAKNKCTECHDIDNSPEFHTAGAFEKYWKKVEHIGKD